MHRTKNALPQCRVRGGRGIQLAPRIEISTVEDLRQNLVAREIEAAAIRDVVTVQVQTTLPLMRRLLPQRTLTLESAANMIAAR